LLRLASSLGRRRLLARTAVAQSIEQLRGDEQDVPLGGRQRRRHGFGQPAGLSARVGSEKVVSFPRDFEQDFASVDSRFFPTDESSRFEVGEDAGERLGLEAFAVRKLASGQFAPSERKPAEDHELRGTYPVIGAQSAHAPSHVSKAAAHRVCRPQGVWGKLVGHHR
jgi:hypothetical protein